MYKCRLTWPAGSLVTTLLRMRFAQYFTTSLEHRWQGGGCRMKFEISPGTWKIRFRYHMLTLPGYLTCEIKFPVVNLAADFCKRCGCTRVATYSRQYRNDARTCSTRRWYADQRVLPARRHNRWMQLMGDAPEQGRFRTRCRGIPPREMVGKRRAASC